MEPPSTATPHTARLPLRRPARSYSPHSSATTSPAGPIVLPDGSSIPVRADETRAGVADLSVTARTAGSICSGTLATNARTRDTGPVPLQRGSEHAMHGTLHQNRISFRRSPVQSDDDDDYEPVQPPDYVITAVLSRAFWVTASAAVLAPCRLVELARTGL